MTSGRPLAAGAAIVAFVIAWIAAAAILADHVAGLNMVVQFAYFATAGFAWVFPVRWLMLWGAGQR